MTPFHLALLLVPFAYLLGSVPFGLIVGKSRGVDPRAAGSGNIGATNVGRLLGKRFFFLVFFLDLLKGLLPMLIAAWVLRGAPDEPRKFLAWLLVGVAAIVGHLFSVFLRFQGGKGVATSGGVILGLFPYFTAPGLIGLALFATVFKASRYISLASIVAAVAFPVLYVIVGVLRGWPVFDAQWPLLTFAVLMAAMIVYKHRGNIARLRAGTENRFDPSSGPRSSEASSPASSESDSPTVGV